MLRIEDLRVELADKVILQHIDLEIKPGETQAEILTCISQSGYEECVRCLA